MMRLAFIVLLVLAMCSAGIASLRAIQETPLARGEDKHKDHTGTKQDKKNHSANRVNPTVVNNYVFGAEDSKQEGQNQAARNTEQHHDGIDKLNAYSTLVIAIFTVLLCGMAFGQIYTVWSTERAWVLVSVKEPIHNETGSWVMPIVKNHGKTSARISGFSLRWHQVTSPDQLPLKPDYGTENAVDLVIPPSEQIFPMSVVIPHEVYQSAIDTQSALYVYGFINYTVVGWKKRKTRFCFMYYPAPSTQPLPPGFYVGIQAPAIYTKTT